METAPRHSSPAWGWALAGAVGFPALTLALGYLPTTPLIALAAGIAGAAMAAGAALAARSRGYPAGLSAATWAIAYVAGAAVYIGGLQLSWPQPDNSVIVRPDGSGGLTDDQQVLLLLLSIAATLLLGAVLEASVRAAPRQRLRAAAAAAAAWTVAMLPLPILIVSGLYATSVLGTLIRVGEIPVHLFGLACSGALIGIVVGALAERVMRGLAVRGVTPGLAAGRGR